MQISNSLSSLRVRIVLIYVLAIVLALVILITITLLVVEEFLVSTRIREQAEQAEQLAVGMAPFLSVYDAEGLYDTARQFGQETDCRVLVLDNQGVVLVDGFSELNGVVLTQPEVLAVIQDEAGSAHGFHRQYLNRRLLAGNTAAQELSSDWVVYYTTAIVHDGNRIGVLLMSTSIQDIVERLARIRWDFSQYSIIVCLGMALLSLIVSALIVRPIKSLTRSIRAFARGQFHQRVRVRPGGRSELTELALTFNDMSEKLENLDRVRSEFISNASHELKTPLSSMKILIESLLHMQAMDPSMTREFLTDINSEIDRLTNIVNDLLNLARMENTQEFSPKRLDIGPVARDVARTLMPLAQRGQVELSVFDNGAQYYVLGVEIQLRQVIYNLVDNAIKHTPEGGLVQLRLEARARHIIAHVRDTGVGIAQEDIAHVFDRFYRVDKARARNTGGTGLGLSIAREIVLRHGGTIYVEHSAEGEGTTMTFEIPEA